MGGGCFSNEFYCKTFICFLDLLPIFLKKSAMKNNLKSKFIFYLLTIFFIVLTLYSFFKLIETK